MVNKLNYYLPIHKVPSEVLLCSVYKNLIMGYSRKKSKQEQVGGVEDIEFSAIVACQVPASYQPLATNKPLPALFSLNAIMN